MPDLSGYTSIQANNFVRIDVAGYSTLTFSDYHRSYQIGGLDYTALGGLLAIADINSDLRATSSQTTVSISGIPTSQISDILDNDIVSSPIKIHRLLSNPITGRPLEIVDNPNVRFSGLITNFSIKDDISQPAGSGQGTITLVLTAASIVDVLSRKIAGRRTNKIDQRKFYPDDPAMDRVATISRSSYQFGGSQ